MIIGSLHLFVVNFGIKTSAPVSLCGKAMFFTGKKKVKSYGILTDRDFYSVLGKGSVRRQEGNSCKSFWIWSFHTFWLSRSFKATLYSLSYVVPLGSLIVLFLSPMLFCFCFLSQVNGVTTEGLRHSEVVGLIRAAGDEVRLLVVDQETDELFNRLGIIPTITHIKG